MSNGRSGLKLKKCPECDAKLPKGADFCPSCDFDITAHVEKQELLAQREKERLEEEKKTKGKVREGFWKSRDQDELAQLRSNLHKLYFLAFLFALFLLPNGSRGSAARNPGRTSAVSVDCV